MILCPLHCTSPNPAFYVFISERCGSVVSKVSVIHLCLCTLAHCLWNLPAIIRLFVACLTSWSAENAGLESPLLLWRWFIGLPRGFAACSRHVFGPLFVGTLELVCNVWLILCDLPPVGLMQFQLVCGYNAIFNTAVIQKNLHNRVT